jgi:hypothetical protein
MANYITELNEGINSQLQKFTNVGGGATILPHNSGLLVRILGNAAGDIRKPMYEVIKIVRGIILNAPFSGIRKG